MTTKNPLVPVAIAFALLATATVPLSGAESTLTTYTFTTGANSPRWTILKLDVANEGIEPRILFESAAFRCPSYWAAWFMTGTPDNASSINSVGFVNAVGRHGVDTYLGTPAGTMHNDQMTPDGEESCLWFNWDIRFGDLPTGTVYLLHITAGVPFEGAAKLSFDDPGVTIEGISTGASSIWLSETNFGGGTGVVAHGPPFCGAPQEALDCPASHFNPGGHVGAAVELGQRRPVSFKNHPFLMVVPRGSTTLTNASLTYPDGSTHYSSHSDATVGELQMNGGRMHITSMGAPPGRYWININKAVHVGALSYAGWHVMGADIKFPGEG